VVACLAGGEWCCFGEGCGSVPVVGPGLSWFEAGACGEGVGEGVGVGGDVALVGDGDVVGEFVTCGVRPA